MDRGVAAPADGTGSCKVSKDSYCQKHDLVRHIPAAEACWTSCTAPGTARTIIRDGATGDGNSVGDLNVVFDVMELVAAMSVATSSVWDGRSKHREGEGDDLELCQPCDDLF